MTLWLRSSRIIALVAITTSRYPFATGEWRGHFLKCCDISRRIAYQFHISSGVRHHLQGVQSSSRRFVYHQSQHKITIVYASGFGSHSVEIGHLSTCLGVISLPMLFLPSLFSGRLCREILSTNLSLILVAPLWPK